VTETRQQREYRIAAAAMHRLIAQVDLFRNIAQRRPEAHAKALSCLTQIPAAALRLSKAATALVAKEG
jgi:hypothetical protein